MGYCCFDLNGGWVGAYCLSLWFCLLFVSVMSLLFGVDGASCVFAVVIVLVGYVCARWVSTCGFVVSLLFCCCFIACSLVVLF